MSRFNTDWLREAIGERFAGGREDFDSWIAGVERAAAEKAWDEGYWQGINGHTGPGNPYLDAALGLTAEQEGGEG